ncbi:uncharacterized protein LOC118646948 [Monomorium pharaonis]|uniref:uncharacterized protein LOC118646948 n=1 Tax=Monomorium pharaonis TaxID=307658 RepID=UPI0017474403|nr:uncharacterized protein LOC118646948 [Monomorium pharaonis]
MYNTWIDDGRRVEDFERTRYADFKDVLEKSYNLASESEATVLPTSDSVFIKISRTPRSAVPPDKAYECPRFVLLATVKSSTSSSPSQSLYVTSPESSTRKVFTSVPLSSCRPSKYVAYKYADVSGVRVEPRLTECSVSICHIYFSANVSEKKDLSRTALRSLTRLQKFDLLRRKDRLFQCEDPFWTTYDRPKRRIKKHAIGTLSKQKISLVPIAFDER